MTVRPKFDPDAILSALRRHQVEFVLIGGLAGGANLARLDAALRQLSAEYDTFHQPPILPEMRRLQSAHGPQLFRTRYGRLDVLKEAGGETYETLQRDASEITAYGATMLCASLAALLRMKRAANRPKDQAAIARLKEVLGDDD